MMRRPIQSRRTYEIEGPALRLAGIGRANRLDRVGGGGRLLVEGTVDEPATVQINGDPAQMRPLPDGDGYVYSRELTVRPGERRLVVEAEDGTGNRTLKSYAVTVGEVERSLTHDINGNLITEAVAGGKTRKYEWDAICRLTAIQSDVVPVAGSWRTEYTYDGQSRRVRAVEKTWNPAGAGSWVVASDHRYLWMGMKICQKRDATGAIPQVRNYDGGERRTVGTVNTDYHYTRDHLGSIREAVTTTGGVYLRYDYTPWGERIKIGGTASAAKGDAFEWGFTGHHYHAKSGLHLALYRAYDANLGRWLSEDPLGEAGGVNLCRYSLNRPASVIDTDGLIPLELTVGVGDFGAGFIRISFDTETYDFGLDVGIGLGVGAVIDLQIGGGEYENCPSDFYDSGPVVNAGFEAQGMVDVGVLAVGGQANIGLEGQTDRPGWGNNMLGSYMELQGNIGLARSPAAVSGKVKHTNHNCKNGSFVTWNDSTVNGVNVGLGGFAFVGLSGGVDTPGTFW